MRTRFEVPEPIICSPFEEPAEHWHIEEGSPAERRPGRRPSLYYYRAPQEETRGEAGDGAGIAIELKLVNRLRERVKAWREAGWPGSTRTTLDLLRYWRREGREHRLFFAQLEAAETIIFLTEARADLRQGIDVPLDEPGDEARTRGVRAFRRYALKMATGAGKTTVMGMVVAWSILNKVNDRTDARFSDAVLVICPNVTIRSRLQELRPDAGGASGYRMRDLVPPHLMPLLARGRVVVTNWHVFEPKVVQAGGTSARVMRCGVRVRVRERITIGPRTTTVRGTRYLTPEDLHRQVAAGLLSVVDGENDREGSLRRVVVESERFIESDASVVNRILGREVGTRQNLLVLNDEAHHAYRIREAATDGEAAEEEEEEEDEDRGSWEKEATVWVEGLDRIHRLRRINVCVDLSATPYYLVRSGPEANRPFPWVVSDFSLTDAIESGLVKIPQLAVRDSSGAEVPGYFNLWHWISEHLTPAERGGRKASPRPEAILKWANHPIQMLAGLWEELRRGWERTKDDPRPPVFIIVCKNTRIAKVVYEWLAEDRPPIGIPRAGIEGFRNHDDQVNTIRVDSRVVAETDTGEAKTDESAWMRFTLDTVGKVSWPRAPEGRSIYPEGFLPVAEKRLGRRPEYPPPGRDVRCIVSVGMLTEGWDCNTVTHIVGLRPFMSQLLCEQVVGRGLRRTSYEVGPDGRLTEEVAKVFGVPFEVIPFKEDAGGPKPSPAKRHHVRAIPERAEFRIEIPRVDGYSQAIRNRVLVDWTKAPPLRLDPRQIPTEVEVKASLLTNRGRPSLFGPGVIEDVTLNPFRKGRRLQDLVFELAGDLTRDYVAQAGCEAPPHVLFPQVARIAGRYLRERVEPVPGADVLDVFLSPYYGWVIERLVSAIQPDRGKGATPEVPRYETGRGPIRTDEVDLWTSREVREVTNSHVNFVVADTKRWEQSAAFAIDRHHAVGAFVKNAGLGFGIPYLWNGEAHDYVPDFVIRLRDGRQLILETKGFDPLEKVKRAAAERWVAAVNADGRYGHWSYGMARRPEEVASRIDEAVRA
ncbi:MAG: DEAD/DEAH box helicase family protein [Planctomycetes bacterium]|nr:DEAD/DEAH box helicase family protein [Planctomycetota bacterium]